MWHGWHLMETVNGNRKLLQLLVSVNWNRLVWHWHKVPGSLFWISPQHYSQIPYASIIQITQTITIFKHCTMPCIVHHALESEKYRDLPFYKVVYGMSRDLNFLQKSAEHWNDDWTFLTVVTYTRSLTVVKYTVERRQSYVFNVLLKLSWNWKTRCSIFHMFISWFEQGLPQLIITLKMHLLGQSLACNLRVDNRFWWTCLRLFVGCFEWPLDGFQLAWEIG